MDTQVSYGKLCVLCGPMFAGKTTELLKRILWAKNGLSKTVLVLKPAFDDRYSSTKICSHDGLSVDAKSISNIKEVENLICDAEMICFDEIQFFTDSMFNTDDMTLFFRDILSQGKDVVVTGLDLDWKGMPFQNTAKLMAMADEIQKLTAACTICGKPAAKTFKKEKTESSIELGHTDKYEARCNNHWK